MNFSFKSVANQGVNDEDLRPNYSDKYARLLMSYVQTDQTPFHTVSNEPSECNMRRFRPFSMAAPPAHYLTLAKIKDIDTNDLSANAG